MNQLDTALPNHDEIALCAFLIWEKEGRQPNREQTYWLQAEAQLRETRQHQAELAAKATRPWPPQTSAAPKVATARAVKAATPKPTRLATAATNAAVKTATITKASERKSASSRKTTARR